MVDIETDNKKVDKVVIKVDFSRIIPIVKPPIEKEVDGPGDSQSNLEQLEQATIKTLQKYGFFPS